ncbi:hypothetical protein [Streptomyces sp. NPDC005538]|uniref:hypothetical protein n=1 Tax=unclassified Streptomyces TaxID=2593676 RepID=UPI0033B2F717
MSLFGQRPEPDPSFTAVLANDTTRSRRRLADNQHVLRETLDGDEEVHLIAVEEALNSRVVTVTSRRLLVVRKGRTEGSYTRDRITRTRLGRLPNGTMLAFVDGAGLMFSFLTAHTADRLAFAVDRFLLTPPVRRTAARDIPELLPDYYRGILFATGKPDTADNIVALVELLSQMLTSNAAMFFRQTGDQATDQSFMARFKGGGPEERLLHVVDDMLDFLWDWNPRCHNALRTFVRDARTTLTGPGSRLWRYGDELPRGLWESGEE